MCRYVASNICMGVYMCVFTLYLCLTHKYRMRNLYTNSSTHSPPFFGLQIFISNYVVLIAAPVADSTSSSSREDKEKL